MTTVIEILNSSSKFDNHLRLALEEIPNAEIKKVESGNGLHFGSTGLSYIDAELGELSLDFLNDQVNYGRKSHRGKSELIAKAIGLAKGFKQVFDATLGLAQDAYFLSQIGAQVVGCERSAVIFLLLKDALHRGQIENLNVQFGDARSILQRIDSPPVIYLDPMFPNKKKSALPRKEMQIFRKLVGDDVDSGELLKLALNAAKDRVVVKRPLKAPVLGQGVVHTFEGSTVRYDLYSPKIGIGGNKNG